MQIGQGALKIEERAGGKIVVVHVSDKLTKDDYAAFAPEFERLIALHGKLRVIFDMRDFRGWTLGALWEDLKFDYKHFRDIERIAMIGEKKWQQWMATFCRPFTTAKVMYFTHDEVEKAEEWVAE